MNNWSPHQPKPPYVRAIRVVLSTILVVFFVKVREEPFLGIGRLLLIEEDIKVSLLIKVLFWPHPPIIAPFLFLAPTPILAPSSAYTLRVHIHFGCTYTLGAHTLWVHIHFRCIYTTIEVILHKSYGSLERILAPRRSTRQCGGPASEERPISRLRNTEDGVEPVGLVGDARF
jgi:hypothetical protein